VRLPTATAIVLLFSSLCRSFAQETPTPPVRDVAGIRAVLNAQVEAWNRGDLERFMHGYWNSPHTAFVSEDGMRRGWSALLERYRRTYPDRQAMGKLRFSDLEVRLLCPRIALAIGRFDLERAQDRRHGFFTLILRRLPEGWRIIQDHTSAAAPGP
jgi:uncharacterized protein (TIGR02246 family)